MTSKWKTVRLGYIARTSKLSGESTGATDYVGLEHLKPGSPKINGTIPASEVSSATTGFLAGDVLFGRLRPYLRKVANADFDGCCTNEILVWRPLDMAQLLPGFLSLILQSESTIDYAVSMSAGSRMPRVSAKSMSDLELALPSLPEQRRIVDLIGALDDAIEAAEERVSAAQTAELQVLDDLVGKPENSQSRTIGELFDVIDCEHKTAPESQTDIFAYSVGTGAIRDGAFRLDRAKPVSKDTYEAWTQRAAPASGDVVLTREAPVGEVALVTADLGPICLGQRTVLLRQKAELPGPVLWAALRTAHYQSLFTQNSIGLTVSRINIKAIKMLKLPELDPERIDTIGAISTQFLHEIESAQEVVASLRTLRTELLTALLSGAHEIPESYDSVMELASA